MKRMFCILMQWRVPDRDQSGLLIEQLRYAGLVKIIKETDDETGRNLMLELHAPHGLDDRVWAQQNARRMKSFGINAIDTYAS